MLKTLPESLQGIDWTAVIQRQVACALSEDLGESKRDLTGELLPRERRVSGKLIAREECRLAGEDWFEACFRQLSPDIRFSWHFRDGDDVPANAVVVEVHGTVREILTAERSAMNFLQTLSGTATQTAQLTSLIQDLPCRLLDTRKTLPGLRLAQKYAVVCGGGSNHRMGLFDRFLIKENHIMAAGGIPQAVQRARSIANRPVEVEVENMDELRQACEAHADIIMLDNFSPEATRMAVQWVKARAAIPAPKLEASGNINKGNLRQYAETGVDFISSGSLTKSVAAVDLSFRLDKI